MADEHTPIFEIRSALAQAGCPICSLAQRSVRRYLSALGFEGVTDRRLRDAIRAAYGFCAAHGRMLREGRDALGSAIIHRDVIANLSRALALQGAAPATPGARLRRALRPARTGDGPLAAQRECTACERAREAERRFATTLVTALGDRGLHDEFSRSAGLCLPHLRLALSLAPDEASHAALREAQLAIWERLIGELDEFIRKQDHRFAHEPSGPEADSWRRAIDLVSGQPECDGS